MLPEARKSREEFFAFAAALVTTCLTLFVISKTIDFQQDLSTCIATYVVPMAACKPEPMERTLYLSSLILFPACLFGYVLLFRAIAGGAAPSSPGPPPVIAPVLLWGAGTAAVYAWALFVLTKNGSFYLRNSIGLDM